MNRVQFFELLSGSLNAGSLAQVQIAYWLAKNSHRDQTRDSGERYFEHVREVALILFNHGYKDEETMILSLLHDGIEDSNTPTNVYVDLFGPGIWGGLFTLSKTIPLFNPVTGQIIGRYKKSSDDYFNELREASKAVRLVKIADRLHNLSFMEGDRWTEEKRAEYARETIQSILPIAQITDLTIFDELQSLSNALMNVS